MLGVTGKTTTDDAIGSKRRRRYRFDGFESNNRPTNCIASFAVIADDAGRVPSRKQERKKSGKTAVKPNPFPERSERSSNLLAGIYTRPVNGSKQLDRVELFSERRDFKVHREPTSMDIYCAFKVLVFFGELIRCSLLENEPRGQYIEHLS